MYRLTFAIAGLLLFSSCSEAQTKGGNEPHAEMPVQSEVINKVVSPAEFKELMGKENAQIVDVRTPRECAGGIIGDAVNIDYTADGFQTEIAKLDMSKPTLIYCASGGRSGKAAKIMKDLGFKEVYDLQGGYNGWPK